MRCTSKRARVGFTVVVREPTTNDYTPPPVATIAEPGPPYRNNGDCIDANLGAQPVPPPPAPDDTIELHTVGRVPVLFGQAVQDILVNHDVAARLSQGLTTKPRAAPGRAPVILRAGTEEGVTSFFCGGTRKGDGAVVAIGGGARTAARVAAHELFHVFSRGVAVSSSYAWFDDMAAEWSVWKAGLGEENAWEVLLQYPDTPFEAIVPIGWRYGMWRFVQYLDDAGYVVDGNGRWPLIRAVVSAPPAFADALDQYLAGRGTRLGAELAGFWGEHLKAKPSRPPRLVPTPPRNSKRITINPGRLPLAPLAAGLRTTMLDFKLSDDVQRVEFEFEPPTDTYFWGLTAPNESRQFRFGDSVSFCVGRSKGEDDLDWPGHFPVTFTNGVVNGTGIRGEIHIFAQTQAEQCATKTNQACRVLKGAGAVAIAGPTPPRGGGFGQGVGGIGDDGRPYTFCSYRGLGGQVTLNLKRWRSSKELRRRLRKDLKARPGHEVHLGDVAWLFEAPEDAFLNIAVGRYQIGLSVTGPGPTSKALRLGRNAVPLVR